MTPVFATQRQKQALPAWSQHEDTLNCIVQTFTSILTSRRKSGVSCFLDSVMQKARPYTGLFTGHPDVLMT